MGNNTSCLAQTKPTEKELPKGIYNGEQRLFQDQEETDDVRSNWEKFKWWELRHLNEVIKSDTLWTKTGAKTAGGHVFKFAPNYLLIASGPQRDSTLFQESCMVSKSLKFNIIIILNIFFIIDLENMFKTSCFWRL